MDYLEAIVVIRWSQMAVSQPSTISHTTHIIQTEFLTINSSSSRSPGGERDDMILPDCESQCNCVDPDEMNM